jgi:hypothetical protein
MSREVHVRFCERREVKLLPATHLVVLCHTRQQALEIKARLARWLEPRGLAFNEQKTRVVTLSDVEAEAPRRLARASQTTHHS